jgi:DNA-3-methyladenine glycosylase II
MKRSHVPIDRVSTLTAAGVSQALIRLAAHEPWVGAALARYGVPPFWQRAPGFASLAQIIIEQQVSLASANAVFARVRVAAGSVEPGALLALGADGLGRAGVTRPKQSALLALAGACSDGSVNLAALSHANDEHVLHTLTALRGIGPWTANVYLIIALCRADVWPANDVALLQALQGVLALRARPSVDEAEAIAARCAPHRSALARLLWHVRLRDTGRQWHV